jgi:hypothetical protein
VFEGEFVNDKAEGKGKLTDPKMNIFESKKGKGFFKNGRL